jgi:hypothetical protein
LILDAVSRRVRLFSDEIASVEVWRKKFTPKAVEISVIEAGSVSELTNDIVLILLRYKGGMLQELQASVRDRLVGQVSLRETCAEQRLEIISKEETLHRAKEGIFELLGLKTQEERQEWEERSKMIPLNPSGVAPVKMPLTQAPHANAMYDTSSRGPTFGGNHDINVADNANSNSQSSTNVGHSYQLPAGQNAHFLTGALHFQAAEIEVFRVTS